jgi:putative membrane protein
MYAEIFVRYAHFISIFAMVSSLVAEHLLLKNQLSRKEIGRIATIDGIYGLTSIFVVGAGLTLWFGGIGKPSIFYTNNWVFLTKLAIVTIAGLLSIYPTVFFLKNRKGEENEIITVPTAVKMTVRVEMLLLFIVPLLAAFMAKGVGSF